MKTLVTIVTPSYNQGRFLRQTIESVLSQDYDQLEYIIIDGGSSDDSVDIIKSYGNKIAYWESRKDSGPAEAINRGMAAAKGQILGYLNSDDILEQGTVTEVVKKFAKDTKLGVVYGDIRFIDENNNATTFPGGRASVYKAAPMIRGALYHETMFVPQQGSFWRRSVFERVGPMQEGNRTCWDHEFFVSAALVGVQFKNLRRTVGGFRIHSNSISFENRWQSDRERDHLRIKGKIVQSYQLSNNKKQYYKLLIRCIRGWRYITSL